MTASLVLWDIDGTLVSCGPSGRLALELAAQTVLGVDRVPWVKMSGKTDPQILSEIMVAAGLEPHEVPDHLPAAMAEAERALAGLAARIGEEGFVQPGVARLLASLAERKIHQTVVTGNVRENARVEVSAFGLERFLDLEVGAYGTDHADRNCLVPIALERVHRHRGQLHPVEDVWVIGDTPHDLACARAAGVRCLLVGTGHDGIGAVDNLGADAVLADLSDTGAVLALLGAGADR